MPVPRQLVHSEWFDAALQRLGNLQDVETVLAKEFYRIACFADLVQFVPGSQKLRIYQTPPLLSDDGTPMRILIYFVLRPDDTVELQHVDAIDEDQL